MSLYEKLQHASQTPVGSWSEPSDLVIDVNDNTIVTGAFFSSVDLGAATLTTPGGATNMFAARIDGNGDFFRVGEQPGSEKRIQTDELVVYPNPGTGHFTILVPVTLSAKAQLIITNVIGTAVVRSSLNITNPDALLQIDLSKQPAGVYFLNIRDGDKTFVKKITLIR